MILYYIRLVQQEKLLSAKQCCTLENVRMFYNRPHTWTAEPSFPKFPIFRPHVASIGLSECTCDITPSPLRKGKRCMVITCGEAQVK